MQTTAQRMAEQLTQNNRSQKLLMFPENLMEEGTANIMRININLPSGSKYLSNGDYKAAVDGSTGEKQTSVYRRPNSDGTVANRFSKNYVRTTSSIDLYMPGQVLASYVSDWGQEELGVLGSVVDAAAGISNMSTWEDAEQAWNVIKNTAKESSMRTIAAGIQAITPLNLETLRKTATSTVANPYMEVLFNGVQNRTFSFTFKMIPQNKREQESVRAIVNELKFHRAPEFKYGGQSNYIIFPSEFDIQFLTRQGENPWLFKISTCALTNITVNHSPEGQYASHVDGSPFATEMTLEFTEMTMLTKELHRQGY